MRKHVKDYKIGKITVSIYQKHEQSLYYELRNAHGHIVAKSDGMLSWQSIAEIQGILELLATGLRNN